MHTYKIHLIRHGLTRANAEGLYCGQTDFSLSPEGENELGRILDSYTYPYAEAVFVSPLSRAVETASILYPETELIAVEDLKEIHLGEFEGKRFADIKNDPDFQRWAAPAGDFVPKGGEDPKRFLDRCCNAAVQIVEMMMREQIGSAAIVTHMGVIGNILSTLGYPKGSPFDWGCDCGFGYTAIADPSLFLRNPVLEVIEKIPYESETKSE